MLAVLVFELQSQELSHPLCFAASNVIGFFLETWTLEQGFFDILTGEDYSLGFTCMLRFYDFGVSSFERSTLVCALSIFVCL